MVVLAAEHCMSKATEMIEILYIHISAKAHCG